MRWRKPWEFTVVKLHFSNCVKKLNYSSWWEICTHLWHLIRIDRWQILWFHYFSEKLYKFYPDLYQTWNDLQKIKACLDLEHCKTYLKPATRPGIVPMKVKKTWRKIITDKDTWLHWDGQSPALTMVDWLQEQFVKMSFVIVWQPAWQPLRYATFAPGSQTKARKKKIQVDPFWSN